MAIFVDFIQEISLNKIPANSNFVSFYYKGYLKSSLLATSALGWCI